MRSKLCIGILGNVLADPAWLGMASYVGSLVREWARGHEVWSLPSSKHRPQAELAGQIVVRRWNLWWSRRQLESKVDVLFSLAAELPEYFYSLHKPKVVFIGGARPFVLQGTRFSRGPRAEQLRLRERQDQIDQAITDSQVAKEEVVKHYGIAADKVAVIYPGVDPGVFHPPPDKWAARKLACQRFQLPGSYLLHVSNYRPVKNVPRILAAFERLGERGVAPAAVVLAGGSVQGEEEVTRAVDEHGGGRVVRLGPLGAEELADLYRGAEAFVFPSIHESFGRCALESMACGVPVVASNISALPEVTGGAAVLVNPESVEEIAAGLEKLLGDRTFYAERSRAGLARSWEFRWEVSARKYLEVFERAILLFAARRRA